MMTMLPCLPDEGSGLFPGKCCVWRSASESRIAACPVSLSTLLCSAARALRSSVPLMEGLPGFGCPRGPGR